MKKLKILILAGSLLLPLLSLNAVYRKALMAQTTNTTVTVATFDERTEKADLFVWGVWDSASAYLEFSYDGFLWFTFSEYTFTQDSHIAGITVSPNIYMRARVASAGASTNISMVLIPVQSK